VKSLLKPDCFLIAGLQSGENLSYTMSAAGAENLQGGDVAEWKPRLQRCFSR
jgi:hypothetical protein